MSSIVLDTHAVVWYFFNSPKLSQPANTAIETAFNNGDAIYLSAISIVEITYLVEKGKLVTETLERLKRELNDRNSNLTIAPLDLSIGFCLGQIPRETVPEMGDRIIAATALSLNLPLVTCDTKIRRLSVIQTIW
jgi:PIN domain nuclease of toxin-antitoxin system